MQLDSLFPLIFLIDHGKLDAMKCNLLSSFNCWQMKWQSEVFILSFLLIEHRNIKTKIVLLSPQEHEKEFLLKDLTIEGLLGGDRRLGEVCSKRVYRILMAKRGCIRTDDVEDGADFFGRQSWKAL